MDFTLKIYRQLLQSLQTAGFSFITFEEYLESEKLKTKSEKLERPDNPKTNKEQQTPNKEQGTINQEQQTTNKEQGTRNNKQPFIILRHDVDLLPGNSLAFAHIQHEMGIKGSYYFRAVPESWDDGIIKEIASLGHEIGYHYENLTTCNGDMKAAIQDFALHLGNLSKLAPVSTICMHGSPQSKWDSKDLWKEYDYHDFGIIGEPYFDMDFDDVFYLTDTGRRWDGWKVSVRDKVPQQERWIKEGLVFRSTGEIIDRVERKGKRGVGEKGNGGDGERITNAEHQTQNTKQETTNKEQGIAQPFPNKIMMTFHPQRWTDSPLPWAKELVLQNAKNLIKGALVRWRKDR
jgi:hypothetical protein